MDGGKRAELVARIIALREELERVTVELLKAEAQLSLFDYPLPENAE